MPKQMHLAFDLSYTHMMGRWRIPGSWENHTYPDVAMYERLAQTAERGCIDMLFAGDGIGVPDTWEGKRDTAVEWGIAWPRQDMNPLAVAMSRVTKHIGFGLTYSTTFMHPYYLARLLNSLDWVTNGRVAVNLVTSTRRADAANFGFDQLMEHNTRYDRMEEFVDVLKLLWNSVEPDAMVWDRTTGQVGDPSKIHDVAFRGKFFNVGGPLNTPPSPQHHPPILQAGASPRGVRACAYVADVAFANDLPLKVQIQQRADLDAALVALGRDPDAMGIMWQTPLVVRRTDGEAQAHREKLLTMVPKDGVGAFIAHNNAYDFSKLPERFKLGELNDEIAATNASPVGFVHRLALQFGADYEMTRDEFFALGMPKATGYENTIAGSPQTIADILEERFEATGSRGGFMLGHTVSMPEDLEAVVDLLVPELQRRGRFRTEYEGTTLRDNLMSRVPAAV